MNHYLIGQRVMVHEKEIAVVIPAPPGRKNDDLCVWVERIGGIATCYSRDNVRPLPNGQL